MKNLILALTLMIPCLAMAQDCGDFMGAADGKPVKVTFYTETAECFTVSGPQGAIHPSPSKRVVFYMNFGTLKTKVTLGSGDFPPTWTADESGIRTL